MQYKQNFDSNFYHLIHSYLRRIRFSDSYYTYLPQKNIYYYFYITYAHPFNINTIYLNIITLTAKDKQAVYDSATLDEFITDMIINNFSFMNDNKVVDPYLNHISTSRYKDLFIPLVGQDMYETLKDNVK